jgi:hypothetical protein
MGVMETFIENQGAISGNNATIPENQMKFYEAGVKAGLAQDPDYAEGYEDGRDAALGGAEWKDILNGNTPVGKAKLADRATEADRAKTASSAISAEVANRAGEADRSYESYRAAHAVNAEEAELAKEATHSAEADHATEADHTPEADYAKNAGHATTATTATSALSAPRWNVDRFVGAISPTKDTEKLSVVNGGFSGDVGEEETVSGETSIPMINSGTVYLCFSTKTACERDERLAAYTITDKVEVYVNNTLAHTLSREYTVGIGGADFPPISGENDAIDTEYRPLLSVSVGDVVTLKYSLTTRRGAGGGWDSLTAWLTLVGIHLKANIITAHTYPTLEVEA